MKKVSITQEELYEKAATALVNHFETLANFIDFMADVSDCIYQSQKKALPISQVEEEYESDQLHFYMLMILREVSREWTTRGAIAFALERITFYVGTERYYSRMLLALSVCSLDLAINHGISRNKYVHMTQNFRVMLDIGLLMNCAEEIATQGKDAA